MSSLIIFASLVLGTRIVVESKLCHEVIDSPNAGVNKTGGPIKKTKTTLRQCQPDFISIERGDLRHQNMLREKVRMSVNMFSCQKIVSLKCLVIKV